MSRSCLNVTDFTADEIAQVLQLAAVEPAALGRPLENKGAALIFEKPSNRTRHSMEMAVVQLGGHPVYTRGDEIGFDVREPVEDIAQVMSGYHAVLAARVHDHGIVERLAAAAPDCSIVNMLSEYSHPLQAFADAYTMQCDHGTVDGLPVAWVGEYNNVARSLAEVVVMLGGHLRIASPVGFAADEAEVERLNLVGCGSVEQLHRPADAVADAAAVHTDTWLSMGSDADPAEQARAFEGFTVDDALMAQAAPTATFMHCLPAYRGREVSAEVMDGPHSAAIRQAHHRLHAARGAMAFLLGVRP